ncbi:MAG: hypothetical protein L3K17_07785 [Thermoplasmata archaeon]|nr:hypothetical protein [Thermoplasmata archaeon]
MVDIHEVPAVPEMDPGGDARLGWFLAGGLLIVIGWGLATILNVVAHAMAPATGTALGPVRVFPHWGLYGEVTLGIGLFTGLIGAGLIWLAYRSPEGRIVLPGYPY